MCDMREGQKDLDINAGCFSTAIDGAQTRMAEQKKATEMSLSLQKQSNGLKACAHLFFALICTGAGWGGVQEDKEKKKGTTKEKN